MTAVAAAGGVDMTSKSHRIEFGALCIAVILLSLWGIIWDISSGLLTSGIDGIMLLLVALMMGGIFSLVLLHMLWQAGLIPFLKPKPADAPPAKAAAAATKPAAAPAAKPPAAPAATTTAPAAAPATPAPKPARTTPAAPPAEPTTK
jgi:pyruvate/2-oxoglutarate dehydrogenase complex dihydrolipoamide acyltransferase (E2) component